MYNATGAAGRRIRVHELARELGVQSKTVLATLKEIGEFVKSSSSAVDESTARRVRQELRAQPYRAERPHLRHSVSPLRDRHSGLTRTSPDRGLTQQELAVAYALGIDSVPHDRRHSKRGPLSGLAKTIRDTFPQIRSDEEARHLATCWAERFIAGEDAAAWWQAGLGAYDYQKVSDLEAHGVRARHLAIIVHGSRAGDLLRGGASVARVEGLLRQLGHLE
jgi:hypothetical protein